MGSEEMKIQEARWGQRTQRQTLQTTTRRSAPTVGCINFESSHSPKWVLFINCRNVAKVNTKDGVVIKTASAFFSSVTLILVRLTTCIRTYIRILREAKSHECEMMRDLEMRNEQSTNCAKLGYFVGYLGECGGTKPPPTTRR